MTFNLEHLTNIEINNSTWKMELKIEDFGINKISIMQELIDKFGFDLIFNSLCETRLKDLKRELDKRISEVEND